MDNRSYFYLSGFLSFFFFVIVITIILFMMISAAKENRFALKKDTFISISLSQVDVQSLTKPQKTLQEVKTKTDVSELKDVDVGDLFSDVWTKKIKIKKKDEYKVDKRRLDLIQKKIKTSKEKNVNELFEQINTNSETLKDKAEKSSTSHEVNEYLAKIQATVYRHFRPPENSEGYSVKAVIELSAIGKVLDFRILTYSSNQALNSECDKIKDRLLGALFPKNPNNISSSTIVYLVSEKN